VTYVPENQVMSWTPVADDDVLWQLCELDVEEQAPKQHASSLKEKLKERNTKMAEG